MNEPRRIIVMSEELPNEKQKEFVEWVCSQGAGWARWFASGWLISAGRYTPGPSVQEIVTKLREVSGVPAHQCLVFELQGPPSKWQGFLKLETLEAAKKWMREEWQVQVE